MNFPVDIDAMCPLKRGIPQLAIAAPYATGKLILMQCVRSRSLLELSWHTPNSTEWEIKVFVGRVVSETYMFPVVSETFSET